MFFRPFIFLLLLFCFSLSANAEYFNGAPAAENACRAALQSVEDGAGKECNLYDNAYHFSTYDVRGCPNSGCPWVHKANGSNACFEENAYQANCVMHDFPYQPCEGNSSPDANGVCTCPQGNDHEIGTTCGVCGRPAGHDFGFSNIASPGSGCIMNCQATCSGNAIQYPNGRWAQNCISTGQLCTPPTGDDGGGDDGGGDGGGDDGGGDGGGDDGGGDGGGDDGGGDGGGDDGGGTGGGGGGGDGGDDDDDVQGTGVASNTCDHPPTSTGDPQLAAIHLQLWYDTCGREELTATDFNNGLAGDNELTDSKDLDVDDITEDKTSEVNSAVNSALSGIQDNGVGSGYCPLTNFTVSVLSKSYVAPISEICTVIPQLRAALIMFAYMYAGIILFRSLTGGA